jgi:hypothetical protein
MNPMILFKFCLTPAAWVAVSFPPIGERRLQHEKI